MPQFKSSVQVARERLARESAPGFRLYVYQHAKSVGKAAWAAVLALGAVGAWAVLEAATDGQRLEEIGLSPTVVPLLVFGATWLRDYLKHRDLK